MVGSFPSRLAALSGLAASVLLVAEPAQADPNRPFPQHVVYAPGSLRPSLHTQPTQDAHVTALYAAWKSRYLAQAGQESDGHPRYRIRTGRDPSNATVSEGQGYGMMIVAFMAGHDPDAQTLIDGLYEYALDHPSTIDSRLMDWRVEADEVPDPSGNDSAFDGDGHIAFALLLAEQQWGNDGRFDYRAAAATRLAGLADSVIGPTSKLPLLGDWVDPSGSPYSEYTPRTSDFIFDHFRAFTVAVPAGPWPQVVAASHTAVDHVQTLHAASTGLLPDFLEPVSPSDPTLRPASPGFLEGPFDGAYYYNALRVPLLLGVDALLSGDAISTSQARHFAVFSNGVATGVPANLPAGFELDGTPLPGSGYFTTAFAAPFAVAAMTDPGQQGWLDALYDAVRDSDENYYEDTLSLISLLVLTGNYWSPWQLGSLTLPALPLGALAACSVLISLLGRTRLVARPERQ